MNLQNLNPIDYPHINLFKKKVSVSKSIFGYGESGYKVGTVVGIPKKGSPKEDMISIRWSSKFEDVSLVPVSRIVEVK